MHDLVLFRDALYVKHQQASTPCNVTAVGHNAQHSDTDMTAPSRSPTHPVSANSWGIRGGGGCQQSRGSQDGRAVCPTLIPRISLPENFTYSTSETRHPMNTCWCSVSSFGSDSSLPVFGEIFLLNCDKGEASGRGGGGLPALE